MAKKRDIYDSEKPSRNKNGELPTFDLTMEQARAKTRWLIIGFLAVVVAVLTIATILIVQREQSATHEDLGLGLSDTNLVSGGRMLATNRPIDTFVSPNFSDIGSEAEIERLSSRLSPQQMAEAMAKMRLADRYLKARDWNQAEEYANQALTIAPDMNAALRMLGVIYTQRGEFDRAIAILESALKTDPFSAETFNNLATAYMHKGNLERAEDLLLTSIQIRPDYVVGYINLGLVYLSEGFYKDAADYLEEGIASVPHDVNIRNNLAVAFIRLGKYEEAREHLQYIVDNDPQIPHAYFNMAIAYALPRADTEAMEWIRRGAERCSPVMLKKFLNDADFDSIRNLPEFREIQEQAYPELPPGPGESR